MKKIALIALGIALVVNTANAQFYFRAGIGYAMPQAGQTMDGTGTPFNGTTNNSTYSTSYSIKSASFSSGIPGTLGFGYMFGDHIGVQLDASIGLTNTQYSYTDNNISYGGYAANETITMQAQSPVLLIPSLVLQTGSSSSWNLYSRLGFALPLASSITQDQVFYVSSLGVTDDYTSKLTSSFSLGFTAAAGVQYRISDKTTIWAELNVLSMSMFLKASKLTNVSENGSSIPLDSVGGAHTIKYSKNTTVDTNYSSYPTYSQPFSNIGVHVGITVQLSKRHARNSDLIDDNKNFKRKKF